MPSEIVMRHRTPQFGHIFSGDAQLKVFAAAGCDRGECRPLWEFLTQDPIVNSSPVMVNGTLYVSGTNFGLTPNLYVFQLPGS